MAQLVHTIFVVRKYFCPLSALSEQKYSNTAKTHANCVIHRLNDELYIKMRIQISKYREYLVFGLTLMKFLQFFISHGDNLLIYY